MKRIQSVAVDYQNIIQTVVFFLHHSL